MSRKKKIPSPEAVMVEAVVWNDAAFVRRDVLDTEPVFMHTVGFIVHEDDHQILVAHEVTSKEDWMESDMDYTQIPKGMIVHRRQLGVVPIQREEEPNETARP